MARARPGPASGATRADAEGLRSRGCSRAEWCYGAVDDEASRCCCLQLPTTPTSDAACSRGAPVRADAGRVTWEASARGAERRAGERAAVPF